MTNEVEIIFDLTTFGDSFFIFPMQIQTKKGTEKQTKIEINVTIKFIMYEDSPK
jgi:hypothetical protein